jgi:hypothetical protein
MKPRARASSALQLTGAGDDEKMSKIVAEVDRFFESVHADIEDWKFSMEDYGDGTRIFVRFQIHINSAGALAHPVRPSTPVTVASRLPDPGVAPEAPGGPASSPSKVAVEAAHGPATTEAGTRADTDLASFVDLWRRKRENNLSGEFHKEGAPYLDTSSEWKGETRGGPNAAPERAVGRTRAARKASNAKP